MSDGKKFYGVDWGEEVPFTWVEMIHNPETGITTVTGASDDRTLEDWQDTFHNHKIEVPDKVTKKIPKEWQEEWQ